MLYECGNCCNCVICYHMRTCSCICVSVSYLCELRVRTVMDNWFCGVDKKDKRAYLISFNEIDENVFEDRKIALKRIHNAEQKYPQVSGETYYEEY